MILEMNYLLHYSVSFSLMQFGSSEMNRKAREGARSMLQGSYWKHDVDGERRATDLLRWETQWSEQKEAGQAES